jgi:hypothetical protein
MPGGVSSSILVHARCSRRNYAATICSDGESPAGLPGRAHRLRYALLDAKRDDDMKGPTAERIERRFRRLKASPPPAIVVRPDPTTEAAEMGILVPTSFPPSGAELRHPDQDLAL